MVVMLGVLIVGVITAIVIDFRAASGKKTRSGLLVTASFALGAVLGLGSAMGAVQGLEPRHVAATCAAFTEMYQAEFENCDDLDIPLFEPEFGAPQFYGETNALVEYDGEVHPIPVTLVWDGATLVLADSAALR